MANPKRLPASLIIVAILFIFTGVSSATRIIGSAMHGGINIDLGVLGLFIGSGLLRLRSGWRTCALVFLWIVMIGFPAVTSFLLLSSTPLNFAWNNQTLGQLPIWSNYIVAAVVALMFAVTVWSYRVLVRPDVCRRFAEVDQPMPVHRVWAVLVAVTAITLLIGEVGAFAAQRWISQRVYTAEVTFQPIDAETKSPLDPQLRGPGKSSSEAYPQNVEFFSRKPRHEITIRWTDYRPVVMVVGAEGYEQKTLTVDQNSPAVMIVELHKSAGAALTEE